MSLRYQYPCPQCEQNIELATKQAGQEITCDACGQSFDAPKMGDIRKLPTVGEAPVRRSTGKMNQTLFTIGLGLAVIAGATGTALHWYASRMIVTIEWDDYAVEVGNNVEDFTPSQVLGLWNELNFEDGLGEWEEQALASNRTQGKLLKQLSYGLFGLAALGLLFLLSSFFMRG